MTGANLLAKAAEGVLREVGEIAKRRAAATPSHEDDAAARVFDMLCDELADAIKAGDAAKAFATLGAIRKLP